MADPVFQPEEHAQEVRPQGTADVTPSRPFDVVELPSKGKLYTEGPLKDKTHIEVYYLTAKEEDILTSPNLLRSGKVMDHLLRSVIVDKNIDPTKMLLGDRNTILVWLRSTGYGEEYPVPLQCKHCNKRFEFEFNLSELSIRSLEQDPDEDGTFSVTLPVTKKVAKVQFLTAEMDAELDNIIASRTKKVGGSGNPMTSRLLYYVKEIEGMTDDQRKPFLETLPVKDSRKIRSFYAEHEPSVVMKQDAKCTQCGEINEEATVPITEHFFWPDS